MIQTPRAAEFLRDQVRGIEDLLKPERTEDFTIQGAGLRWDRAKVMKIFRTFAEEKGLKIVFKFDLPFSGRYRFSLSGPSHKVTEASRNINSLLK